MINFTFSEEWTRTARCIIHNWEQGYKQEDNLVVCFGFLLMTFYLTPKTLCIGGHDWATSAHTHSQLTSCDSLRWTAKGLSHTCTCIHSLPNVPPIKAGTYHWAEFHVLYNRSVLVIHFKYRSVYMTFPKFLTIPPPSLGNHKFLF